MARYIHDRRDGERRVVLEAHPPALGRHVLDQLFSVTLAAALEAGVCVVAGTQARTLVPAETYERLVADLVETGVQVVADLAGDLLAPALAGRPHVLKISHEELIEDGYARDDSLARDGTRDRDVAGSRRAQRRRLAGGGTRAGRRSTASSSRSSCRSCASSITAVRATR